RCPTCEEVLLRLVRGPGRAWLDLRGVTSLQVTVPGGGAGRSAPRPVCCQRLIAWAACGAPVSARGCGMSTPGSGARSAIVTVGDEPGVSGAVARDLRRRYGERQRIVRAESGDAALDALREMRLRGDEVAVIVADYRMPGMNGIEFLERAMDLYPSA